MRKIIIITIFLLATLTLSAFEGFMPATELSGTYLKFSSYYKKTYDHFDSGFHDFGFLVARPHLYRNFGLAIDGKGTGDQIHQKLELNISPGYRVTSWLSVALSAGFVHERYSEDDMDLGQSETLDSYGQSAVTYGASMHMNFWNNRVQLAAASYYMNQPEMSFLDGDEQFSRKTTVQLDWRALSWLKLSPYMVHESYRNQMYYGVNVGISAPSQGIGLNTDVSGEKVSIIPEINTLNYWTFKVGYDYMIEEDLNGTNYFVFASYEHVTDDELYVSFDDERMQGTRFETEDKMIALSFSVAGQERLKSVIVKKSGKELIYKRNLREYDSKNFKRHIDLEIGSNPLEIFVEGVNGEPYQKRIDIVRIHNEIKLANLPDIIYNDDLVNINWRSSVINGIYDIFLMHNGEISRQLNEMPIAHTERQDGIFRIFEMEWLASGLEDGPDHTYQLKLIENRYKLEILSSPFTGDPNEKIVVLIEEELPRIVIEEPQIVIDEPAPAPEPLVVPDIVKPTKIIPQAAPVVKEDAVKETKKSSTWILYLLLGLVFIFLFIFFWRRRKKE